MNVSLNNAWLLALTAFAGLGTSGPSLAQEATAPAAGQPFVPSATSAASPMAVPPAGSFGGDAVLIPGNVRVNLIPSIHAAAAAVRDAEGAEAKADAQKKLAGLLEKHFDDDMVRREQELAQIEQRLTKLRELLDRRRTKKQEIVELQAKVALNDAEGLGFYGGEHAVDSFGPGALPAYDPLIRQ